MIVNAQELATTLERIRRLQAQLAHLRLVETNAASYRLPASGLLAEVDRMQLEVREYLVLHPTDLRPPRVSMRRTSVVSSLTGTSGRNR